MPGARGLVSGHVTSTGHSSVMSISYPESSGFCSAGELPEELYRTSKMTSEKTDVGHGSALPPYYSPQEGHPAPQAGYYPGQVNYSQQQGIHPQQGSYPPPIEAQPTHFHTTNTTVVVSQPAMEQQRPRQWSTGLFGCCEDCGVCWYGWCFPECLICDVSSRMGEGCCFPFCCPMALAGLRVKLRTQENIQGTACDDYCCAIWCGRLVLCQLARELNHIGK